MADSRFFSVSGPFTVAELAEMAQADLPDGVDGSKQITDIAPLDAAGGDAISFINNKRYFETFTKTRAGACIASPKLADGAPPGTSILLSETPQLAFARVARAFYPQPRVKAGISPRATIDAMATLGKGCRVDPGAVIGARSEIGGRCHIGAIASIDGSSGVSFSEGGSPPVLPGGNGPTYSFDPTFRARANNPAPKNGVNPGESLWIVPEPVKQRVFPESS